MLQTQLGKFIIAGLGQVGLDFVLYSTLLLLNVPMALAKGISFICCTLLAYFLNKNWTFNHQGEHGIRWLLFIFVYTVSLCLNVSANAVAASYLQHIFSQHELYIVIAFVVATGLSATFNFLGLKFIVFRAPGGQK